MQRLQSIVCVLFLLCGLVFAKPASNALETVHLLQLQETLKRLSSSILDMGNSGDSGANLLLSGGSKNDFGGLL